jgi:transglutaminase-like putative cysteine protease
MNGKLTAIAALATFLASLALSSDLRGGGWFTAAIGAVIAVAIAGTLTRLPIIPSAIAGTVLVLMAVSPLFGLGWAPAVGGLAIAAVVGLSATGARPLRVLAAACTYLAALLLFLNIAFAAAQSLGRILPTVASMQHLNSLISGGEYQFKFEPPLPLTSGLILLTAAGVGLIAIAVDILAVRLHKPAIAGLPLLVLFCVPIASNLKHINGGLTIAFIFGITGFLALLAADSRDRLRTWGKLVTLWTHTADEPDQGPNTRSMAASGRRIGLAALCLAIIVPLLLPGLTERDLFGHKHVAGNLGPGGSVVLPDPVGQLQGDLRVEPASKVLSYTTTSSHTSEQYLQLYVLNYNPSNGTWILDGDKKTEPAGHTMAGVPGLVPQTSRLHTTTSVTMADVGTPRGELSFLAVPYAPTSLSVSAGNWSEGTNTLMVSANHRLARLTYTVHSEEADPTPAQLDTTAVPPPAIEGSYGNYTGPYWHQLLRIAEQHTKGATTELAKATALQQWFTSGAFTYTLHPSLPTGPDWIVKFLTSRKRGFCQQFAIAYATLARLLGIPSRVAEGFTAGAPSGHHVWTVTTADAHMWPELYFAGAGWLRFEPTPGGFGGQGTATTPAYAAGVVGPGSKGGGAPPALGKEPGHARNHGNNAAINKERTFSGPAGTHPGTGLGLAQATAAGRLPWLLAGVIVLALLLLAPVTGRFVTRRRRWHVATDDAGLARAAWLELVDDLADHGVVWPGGDSPRGLARRIVRTAGLDLPARQAVTRIAAAEEQAVYAPAPGPGTTLKQDVLTVRRGVAASVPVAWRWRARLMPASTITAIVAAGQRAANLLTSLDRALARLRSRAAALLRRPTTS